MAGTSAAEPSKAMSGLSLDDPEGPSTSQGPMKPPSAAGGIVSFDITEKFSAAAKALTPGELVKDGFFTLFEGVGALEIMDKKMDSGCLDPGESLDHSYDVTRSLLPEEVLGIIDQLLCHEMAWHIGYPLSQTILTSVYVESVLMPTPSIIEDAHFIRDRTRSPPSPMHEVLRAYCLGLLKACGEVNDRIMLEHYYEEEDFVTNTYHRNLLDQFTIEAVQEAIAAARKVLGGLSDVSPDLAQALDDRLHLRHTFLTAIDHVQYRTNPDLIRRPWQEAAGLLKAVQTTHFLGRPVPEACSAKLQRRLASTMPPRPIVELSFDAAFGHLTRLFEDGVEVIEVLRYTDSQCLQTFVMTFQAKKPQPLVYIRTLLQSFLFKDMEVLGHMSIRQLMDNDLAIATLPGSILLDRANDEIEAPKDPRFIVAEQMEVFRKKAAQPFLDILRTFCQNRCRVRRTLCHIIRDWETLQFDAEDIDQIMQHQTKEKPVMMQAADGSPVETFALSLSSWAFLYKIKLMEWIVQLGFELEVYHSDELVGMYWYLQYLSRLRLSHVERIKGFVAQSYNEALESGHIPSKEHTEFTKSLAFIRLNLLDAAVTCELADALCCLYIALQRLGLIKLPPRPYGTDELRYELRMKPFAVIGHPALPSLEEFTAGSQQTDHSTTELLSTAARAVAGAKRGIEAISKLTVPESFSVGSHERWLPGVKNMLKSCIALGLAVSAVQRAQQVAGTGALGTGALSVTAEVPTPEKSYHAFWVVPRIVPVKK